MAAAALRSSAGISLQRVASCRLSSAGSKPRVRMMHCDFPGRSDSSGPPNPEDKYDGYFAVAAAVVAAGVFELIEGDYFGLGKLNGTRPRVSRRRR